MDESALRTIIANLDTYRSSLHWWLEVFTGLVVAGVVLEVVFVIWEYLDELHDFQRGVIHPPDRPKTSMFILGLLGAALVAVGVAGELREGATIETLETLIRKANNELYVLLSNEAGDAAKSAKTEETRKVRFDPKFLRLYVRANNPEMELSEQDWQPLQQLFIHDCWIQSN